MKLMILNDGAYGYASGDPCAHGGTERDEWLLARALAASGWSVIVGVREAMELGERKTIEGVEFAGIGKGHILYAWHKFLCNERPDWLYWEGANHLWGLVVELARNSRVRTIFSAASDLDLKPRSAAFHRPRLWPLYAWGLSRADRIFVQHAEQFHELRPSMQDKSRVLPKLCALQKCLRPHIARSPRVAWVGNLGYLKRPDLLIEICRRAQRIRFVVCGGPTAFMSPPAYGSRIVDELRKTSNVDYQGQVSPGKADEIMANAAVLLSTSDVEGFPNTFVQAWSGGTPVISLKIDPEHLIENRQLGRISGNVDTAVVDINTLIASPELRDEIGIRARKYIADCCCEKAVVEVFNKAVAAN